jgi:hypothetical protein
VVLAACNVAVHGLDALGSADCVRMLLSLRARASMAQVWHNFSPISSTTLNWLDAVRKCWKQKRLRPLCGVDCGWVNVAKHSGQRYRHSVDGRYIVVAVCVGGGQRVLDLCGVVFIECGFVSRALQTTGERLSDE